MQNEISNLIVFYDHVGSHYSYLLQPQTTGSPLTTQLIKVQYFWIMEHNAFNTGKPCEFWQDLSQPQICWSLSFFIFGWGFCLFALWTHSKPCCDHGKHPGGSTTQISQNCREAESSYSSKRNKSKQNALALKKADSVWPVLTEPQQKKQKNCEKRGSLSR